MPEKPLDRNGSFGQRACVRLQCVQHSTTSTFKRSYFYDNFAKDGFDLLFVDKDIGDEHALLKEHGRYWWNEDATVFEPAE